MKKKYLSWGIPLSILGSIFAVSYFFGTQDSVTKQAVDGKLNISSGSKIVSHAESVTSGYSNNSKVSTNKQVAFLAPSVLEVAKADVDNYIEFSQYANRAEKKQAMFEQWELKPEMLKLQHDILVKNGLAESIFKENQAHARLLAIDYLGYLSINGERDAIENTISDLSHRINNEKWVKGIQHDYVDLMFKYTDSLTQGELMSSFEEIIEFSGYSKKTHDLFTTGLSLSDTVLLLPDNKMEELKARLNLVKEEL